MRKNGDSSSKNEGELLTRLAQREEGAAESFVLRFRPLLWMMAQRYCASWSDAEDAVQDILLELWKTASRFDPERGSATTFVATVARRRLIDRLRRSQASPPMDEIPDGAESRLGSPEHRLLLSKISSALEQLRPHHRRVLEMSLVQGYTHVEIADAMELPLGTVKTITRRSVQRVRDSLDALRSPAPSTSRYGEAA